MQLILSPQMQPSTSSLPRPHFPAQSFPNPNNSKAAQPTQAVGIATFPTYSISSQDCHDIHLGSGKNLTKEHPHVHIEDINEEVINEELEPVQSPKTSRIDQGH